MIQPHSDTHPFDIVVMTLSRCLSETSGREVALLETFAAEWDRLEFSYQGQPAMLIRIPKPQKEDGDVLVVATNFYLSAYLLTCPKKGCVTKTHRGNPRKLVCRCHGEVYWASDGTAVAGGTDQKLLRLGLKIRAGRVYATT